MPSAWLPEPCSLDNFLSPVVSRCVPPPPAPLATNILKIFPSRSKNKTPLVLPPHPPELFLSYSFPRWWGLPPPLVTSRSLLSTLPSVICLQRPREPILMDFSSSSLPLPPQPTFPLHLAVTLDLVGYAPTTTSGFWLTISPWVFCLLIILSLCPSTLCSLFSLSSQILILPLTCFSFSF